MSEPIRRMTGRDVAILAVLSSSQLLIVVDATIVNVALGPIQDGLDFSTANLQWVVTAYTLAFGGLLLAAGGLADRFGHRRIFLVGVIAFGLASLVGGAATHQGVLVGARAVQGAGAAAMAPAALALVLQAFAPGRMRALAFGVWATVTAGGTALGSVLGGLLTEAASWRWVLWINVPIAVLVVGLSLALLPRSAESVPGPRVDVSGALIATAGLATLVYGLTRGADHGWSPTPVLILAASGVLLAAFAFLQTRRRDPLLPRRILQSSTVVAADLTGLILGVGVYALFYFVSLFLSTVQDKSPVHVGLAFVPMTIAIAVAARVSGALADQVSPHRLAAGGAALVATGLVLLARIEPTSGYADTLLPGMLLAGFGLGMTFVPLTSAAMSGAGPADSGIAAALFNAAQQIGGALGLAVLTTISAAVTAASDARLPTDAITEGWSTSFLCAGLLTLAGAAIAAAWIRPHPTD